MGVLVGGEQGSPWGLEMFEIKVWEVALASVFFILKWNNKMRVLFLRRK